MHGIDRGLGAGAWLWPMAFADHLAAPELHLLALHREVLIDLDDQRKQRISTDLERRVPSLRIQR